MENRIGSQNDPSDSGCSLSDQTLVVEGSLKDISFAKPLRGRSLSSPPTLIATPGAARVVAFRAMKLLAARIQDLRRCHFQFLPRSTGPPEPTTQSIAGLLRAVPLQPRAPVR